MSAAYWPDKPQNQNFVPAPIDPGLWRFTKAVAQDTFAHNPVPALYGAFKLLQADSGPMLNLKEANEKYGIPGELDLMKSTSTTISEHDALLLNQRKRNELNRQFVMAGADRGVTGFAVGLATSIVDPINIASGFIPVVGQARYAKLLQMTGGRKWAARAIAGAAEGAVGSAMVEPLILIPAMMDQSNYGLADSAMNFVFGGAIGAGLHVGAGALGDWYRSRPAPKTKAATEVLSQLADLPSGVIDDGTLQLLDELIMQLESEPKMPDPEIMDLGDVVTQPPTKQTPVEAKPAGKTSTQMLLEKINAGLKAARDKILPPIPDFDPARRTLMQGAAAAALAPQGTTKAIIDAVVPAAAAAPAAPAVARNTAALVVDRLFANGTLQDALGPMFDILDEGAAPEMSDGDAGPWNKYLHESGKSIDFSKLSEEDAKLMLAEMDDALQAAIESETELGEDGFFDNFEEIKPLIENAKKLLNLPIDEAAAKLSELGLDRGFVQAQLELDQLKEAYDVRKIAKESADDSYEMLAEAENPKVAQIEAKLQQLQIEANPLTKAVADMSPEAHESAMRNTVAQILNDEPVTAGQVAKALDVDKTPADVVDKLEEMKRQQIADIKRPISELNEDFQKFLNSDKASADDEWPEVFHTKPHWAEHIKVVKAGPQKFNGYHGSTENFYEIDTSLSGTGGGVDKGALFFTSSKEVANTYRDDQTVHMIAAENFYDDPGAPPSEVATGYYDDSGSGMSGYLHGIITETNNTLVLDMQLHTYDGMVMRAAIRFARSKGFDSILFKDFIDVGVADVDALKNPASDVLAVLIEHADVAKAGFIPAKQASYDELVQIIEKAKLEQESRLLLETEKAAEPDLRLIESDPINKPAGKAPKAKKEKKPKVAKEPNKKKDDEVVAEPAKVPTVVEKAAAVKELSPEIKDQIRPLIDKRDKLVYEKSDLEAKYDILFDDGDDERAAKLEKKIEAKRKELEKVVKKIKELSSSSEASAFEGKLLRGEPKDIDKDVNRLRTSGINQNNFGPGAYWTDDAKMATHFAGAEGRIVEKPVKLERPLDFRVAWRKTKEFSKLARLLGLPPEIEIAPILRDMTPEESYTWLSNYTGGDVVKLNDKLVDAGYDGIISKGLKNLSDTAVQVMELPGSKWLEKRAPPTSEELDLVPIPEVIAFMQDNPGKGYEDLAEEYPITEEEARDLWRRALANEETPVPPKEEIDNIVEALDNDIIDDGNNDMLDDMLDDMGETGGVRELIDDMSEEEVAMLDEMYGSDWKYGTKEDLQGLVDFARKCIQGELE